MRGRIVLATPHWEPGMSLEGPALIVEEQTSTYASGRFDAKIAADGAIILETKPEHRS